MKSFSRTCDVCGTINPTSHSRCLTCGNSLSMLDTDVVLTPALPTFFSSNKLLKKRYNILRVAGKGGMGMVYIGEDTHLGNRLVAIKEMSQSGLSPLERLVAAKNFKHEAHLLAELQHPHLPSIYDYFEEDQRWYLVMSFVKGQTLVHHLDTQYGKLPVKEVIEIGIVLCNVLHYLHTHQPPIIFRDLKPSNIMRTSDGHIYLIDFGVARFFKPGQMNDTTNYGTSGYASPEQYGSAQTTPRSDIYSLGATLYKLLSGYEPANTPFLLPPLHQLLPTIPMPLVKLITQMLDLDERKRPQSAEIVKQELQNISNSINSISSPSTPVISIPPPLLPLKRNKWIIATLTAMISVTFFTVACWLLINSNASNPNSPYGVVNTFCNAMNSQTPDFQTAYHQLSRSYQSKHSLISFQKYFQGTIQCVIASRPDGNNQAGINLAMLCPHGPPPLNAPPPLDGSPPPDGPPPLGGPPPPNKNLVDLTVINVGTNGWKIDSLYVIGYRCGLPIGQP